MRLLNIKFLFVCATVLICCGHLQSPRHPINATIWVSYQGISYVAQIKDTIINYKIIRELMPIGYNSRSNITNKGIFEISTFNLDIKKGDNLYKPFLNTVRDVNLINEADEILYNGELCFIKITKRTHIEVPSDRKTLNEKLNVMVNTMLKIDYNNSIKDTLMLDFDEYCQHTNWHFLDSSYNCNHNLRLSPQ